MGGTVLITGGAGFIGAHLADELLRAGYHVRALDCLSPQVHGDRRRPASLAREVELQIGDVRDSVAVHRALDGVEAVFHFAARVGGGQSRYEIAEYTSVNNVGTAVLLEALAERPVAKLVVASSMSVYGEGLYRAPDGRNVLDAGRAPGRLRQGDWEPRTRDGSLLSPLPTPEWKQPNLLSVYALTKFDQERMCLLVGRARGIPTVALRLFNAYGPRQALSNPYTGVLAIFAARLMNGRAPLVSEDGLQRRDYVSVHDVVLACRLALEVPTARDCVLNIGSGHGSSVLDIAQAFAQVLGCEQLVPEITGKHRVGDVRHCFANIDAARDVLGYEPRVSLEQGLRELASSVDGHLMAERILEASAELERGLAL